ncbi:MAG TPA: superoxide dismutase [Persephonella sp.]|nr:superoxide dismutase [Persephonella sp.]
MKKLLLLAGFLIVLSAADRSYAHCEIPCGIYDDQTRIHLMEEYIATMEKSIYKIKELSGKKDPHSYNQLVRWIDNKDRHAEKFQKIVWQYFLTQRVKPAEPEDKEKYKKYIKQIELLHKLSFYAMKVKQNVDTKYTKKLYRLLNQFEEIYFGKKHSH